MSRRVRFQPGLYLSESSEIEKEVPKGVTSLESKSGTEEKPKSIDLNRWRELLTSLRPYASSEIPALPPSIRDNFRKIQSYIDLLYDSDYYPIIYSEANSIFNLESVIPGTVGAYFAGCRLSRHQTISNLDMRCAPVCSGSMPTPKNQNEAPTCNYTVIIGRPSGDKLDFIILSKIKDSNRALLFLPLVNPTLSSNIKPEPSTNLIHLSSEDRKSLESFGIKEIKVIGYSTPTESHGSIGGDEVYLDLINWTPIKDLSTIKEPINPLPPNLNNVTNTRQTTTSTSGIATFGIILIIIVLLLIGFGIWYMLSHQK